MKIGAIIIAVGSNDDVIDTGNVFPVARNIVADLQYYIDGGKGPGGSFDGYHMTWTPVEAVDGLAGLDHPEDQVALLEWAIKTLQISLAGEKSRAKEAADAAP